MPARLFKLRETGVAVRARVMAGRTTFLTMACIVLVNPTILSLARIVWLAAG